MTTKPCWISHRGLCQHADENSVGAFTAAEQAGFDYLETDLRLSADGHIVLSHDMDLNRCASHNIKISHYTRSQLQQIELNHGGHLLFFDQFLQKFGQLGHVLDIKPENGFEVIAQLEKFAINFDRTTFLLWSGPQQQALQARFAQARCFANEAQCRRAGFAMLAALPCLAAIEPGKVYALPPAFKGLNLYRQPLIQRYHHKQAKVLAYLPETPEQAQMAINAGVDYVLSNHDFGFCRQ